VTTAEELLLPLVGVEELSHLGFPWMATPGLKVVSSKLKSLREEVGTQWTTRSVLGSTR
jgi:hypothetical protein